MTLDEAIATGRRYRRARGTGWRQGPTFTCRCTTGRATHGPNSRTCAGIATIAYVDGRLIECLGFAVGAPEATDYVVERTEDEFEGDALEILNNIGIREVMPV